MHRHEAGVDGFDQTIAPEDPCGPGESREASAVLSQTLSHVVEALRADRVLLDAFGIEHPVGAYLAQAKEDEFLTWHSTVADWEIDSYLTAH